MAGIILLLVLLCTIGLWFPPVAALALFTILPEAYMKVCLGGFSVLIGLSGVLIGIFQKPGEIEQGMSRFNWIIAGLFWALPGLILFFL